MDPDETISRIAASQTIDDQLDLGALLTATRGGVTGTELVAQFDFGGPTVYRGLNFLTDREFVVNRDEDGFAATNAGVTAFDAYERVATQVDEADLAYLAASPDRYGLLRAISERPQYKRDLAAGSNAPSRTTVHRTLRDFEQRGWTEQMGDGRVHTKESAEQCLQAYEWLRTAMAQATEKAPLINQLPWWADPELPVLAGSELVIETEEEPHAVLNAAVEAANLRDGNLERLRTIVPVFDKITFERFGDEVNRDAEFEILLDRRAYNQLTRPQNLAYLAGGLLAPNVEMRVYAENLYLGLGIYDDTVLVGGSTEANKDAAVVGENEQLRTWADQRFETLWTDAETIPQRLRRWVNDIAARRQRD